MTERVSISSSSVGGGSGVSHAVTSYRRGELIELAKSARLRWILADISASKSPTRTKVPVEEVKIETASIIRSPPLEPFPAVGCLQDIFNCLTDLCKDDQNEIDAYDGFDILELIPEDESLVENCVQSDEQFHEPDEEGLDVDDSVSEYYHLFLDKLRRSEAIDVVRSMRRFVNDIKSRLSTARSSNRSRFQLSDEDQSECISTIWKFLSRVLSQLREITIFADNKFVASKVFEACCEKFLFIKLYDILFAADAEDSQLDRKLKQRMKDLQFITTEHLDVKSVTHGVLDKSVSYLRDINKYKAPSDKFLCIKFCVQSIADVLKADKTEDLAGADDLLPMMILALKEANPEQLHSNIKYIQSYMNPRKLAGESGYIITQFISAAIFLQNADAAALTISPVEFERAIEHCKDLSEKALEKGRKGRDGSTTEDSGSCITLKTGAESEGSEDVVKLLKNKSIHEIHLSRSRTIRYLQNGR